MNAAVQTPLRRRRGTRPRADSVGRVRVLHRPTRAALSVHRHLPLYAPVRPACPVRHRERSASRSIWRRPGSAHPAPRPDTLAACHPCAPHRAPPTAAAAVRRPETVSHGVRGFAQKHALQPEHGQAPQKFAPRERGPPGPVPRRATSRSLLPVSRERDRPRHYTLKRFGNWHPC